MSCFTSLISLILFPCALLGMVIKCMFSLICWPFSSRRVVGIFSRSASEEYEWLLRALNSSMFRNVVKNSRAIYISNREENVFREVVQQCDFTILYHTKNRGRINITNVTDSLYDEQLKFMFNSKGREKVIVIVDDLEMGDSEEKRRILQHQPDIMKYSHDLVLVTSNDKRQPQLLDKKLQQIRALISAQSWSAVNCWCYLLSMIGWACNNTFRRRGTEELEEPLLPPQPPY
ncbi:uncharacterized protein LOC142656562 isoform X2 [Rhinoderma darwinii]|uniref:uncharacterized protein LOC142656562 isoform X2 n=1 Tax=Rhinoderma darwinii TaxID=43563 RepID=UPI003F6766F2